MLNIYRIINQKQYIYEKDFFFFFDSCLVLIKIDSSTLIIVQMVFRLVRHYIFMKESKCLKKFSRKRNLNIESYSTMDRFQCMSTWFSIMHIRSNCFLQSTMIILYVYKTKERKKQTH